MSKYLGKIIKAEYGFRDICYDHIVGLYLDLKFDGYMADRFAYAEFASKETTFDSMAEFITDITKILTDARVQSISQLQNKPIEVTEESGIVKHVRILTEVL